MCHPGVPACRSLARGGSLVEALLSREEGSIRCDCTSSFRLQFKLKSMSDLKYEFQHLQAAVGISLCVSEGLLGHIVVSNTTHCGTFRRIIYSLETPSLCHARDRWSVDGCLLLYVNFGASAIHLDRDGTRSMFNRHYQKRTSPNFSVGS